MGLLTRIISAEIATSAALGASLFLLVLFLQRASQLFSILVNSSASPWLVGYLFVLLIPILLPLTLPLGVLTGTLIALSRMSNDGEIIALRAAGVPSRRVARPVAAFALLATALAAYCTLSLTPWCEAKLVKIVNRIAASQLTAEIQPRVFDETFPNTILYVSDVIPGKPAHWRGVFMADTTPADQQRKSTGMERGEGPRVTLARDALVDASPRGNHLQLNLLRESSYEAAPDPTTYYHVTAPRGQQDLEAKERGEEKKAKAYTATPTRELLGDKHRPTEASIELHRRFALPLACLLLGLVGVPLGVSSRKGGKSAAFAITVFFAFLYFTILIGLIGLAKDGRLKPAVAVWMPDAIFAVIAVVLLARLELPVSGDRWGAVVSFARRAWRRVATFVQRNGEHSNGRGSSPSRLFLLPQIIDTYVLGEFIYYFVALLGSFVVLTEVFNFFELLGDVFRNSIPMRELFEYLFFLAPKLIYDTAPISVLVASLVTFGLLSKNNEIVALRACGVSLYRLALPVLFTTAALSVALFLFDHSVVTQANIIQDGLRNKIKGRSAQTYLNPTRKIICGNATNTLRIYYYRHFDQDQGVFGGVQIFEIEPREWRLVRHLLAERAHWEPALKMWVFENGWVRQVGLDSDHYRPFLGNVATFEEINEPPSWFLKEVKTYKQLNSLQLLDYIDELARSGFNTVPLQVQYHKKFAVPLFVFVMALLSVPFAFMTGNRGAMTGVGVSLGVALAYFVLNYLFEQLGGAGQLPPALAAWAPDGIFALAGVYLMMRMRS